MNLVRSMLVTAAMCASAVAAHAGTLTVEVNETKALRLGTAASGVVIGNPAVADVTVHSPNMLFITGRGYGHTNLLVVDEEGRQIYAAEIEVTADGNNVLTLTRGGVGRETYSCNPTCLETPRIGDSQEFFSTIQSQAEALREAATED